MTIWHGATLVVFSIFALPRSFAVYPYIFAIPVIVILMSLFFGRIILRVYPLLMLAALLLNSLLVATITSSHILNVILSTATYSSLFFFLIRPIGVVIEKEAAFFGKALLAVAGFQALLGLGQVVLAGFPIALPYRDFSPDVFSGTMGPGGHQLVTALFVAAFFWLQGEYLSGGRRSPVWMIMAGAVIVLPGSVATILCFICALLLSYLLWPIGYRGARALNTRWSLKLIAARSVLVFVVGWIFIATGNLAYLMDKLGEQQRTPDGYQNARVDAMVKTFTELPFDAPYQPLVGLGLGNYSSWSQLLLSGVYWQRFIAGSHMDGDIALPTLVREEAWQNVLIHLSPSYIDNFGRWYVESIFTQPYWTWQSIYAETGILGLAVILGLMISTLRLGIIRPQDPRAEQALRRFVFSYGIFFVLSCFIDNYLEYPWVSYPLLYGLVLAGGRKDPTALGRQTL